MKIRFKPEYYLLAIFALCFIAFQQVQDNIRPDYNGNNRVIEYLLGVAPNFFPAIGIPCLFVVLIPILSNGNKTNIWLNNNKHLSANLTSVAGLLSWEFLQTQSTKGRFDWNDVLWTLIGAFIFHHIWLKTPMRKKEEPKII